MALQGRVVELLNAKIFTPSYGMRSRSRNPNFIKMLVYMRSQELPLSIRIPDIERFTILVIMAIGSITLRIKFTFSVS